MSTVSYGVEIENLNGCLNETYRIYRDCVAYLINISLRHYDLIQSASGKDGMNAIERLVHTTANREAVYQEFDKKFYKFPSYLRRNAIMAANAKVITYLDQIEKWEKNGSKGKKPHLNRRQDVMPCFYRGNMFVEDQGHFYIKILRKRDWVWMEVQLRKTDVDYIKKNCQNLKESAPVLSKKAKHFELRFAYPLPMSAKRFVKDENIQTTLGVDLGIHHDAVCSVVKRDGTVTGCKFINHPVEKDRLYTTLNRIRKCQSKGNKRPSRLWRFVDNYSREIVIKTAIEIVEYARYTQVDAIVFEDLSKFDGHAHSVNKQRIALWRKREIQERVESMASRYGIRVAYVVPHNTSKLAFDGSGEVKRGTKGGFSTNAVCQFKSGKVYNTDLSASKNIAARFLIRCISKSISETKWLQVQAKVPGLSKRTSSTLATLINLFAVVA